MNNIRIDPFCARTSVTVSKRYLEWQDRSLEESKKMLYSIKENYKAKNYIVSQPAVLNTKF